MLSLASWKFRAGMAAGFLALLACAPDALSQLPPPGGNVTPPPTPGGGNKPPSVTIVAVQQPNNAWTFKGKVTDEAPGGLIVRLSGSGLSGINAVTEADGSFSVTVNNLPPGASGYVTATVTDPGGLTGSGSTYFG
jgi:hypothetical protein